MGNIIPFFYYDILARVLPGAITLAVVAMTPNLLPASLMEFVNGKDGWKPAGIPLLLGGLAYAIGVIYEVFDYAILRKLTDKWEETAFQSAWSRFSRIAPVSDALLLDGQNVRPLAVEFRRRLWSDVVLEGSQDSAKALMFAHCHRFQAEYKMFLHLFYPSLLLSLLSLHPCHPVRAIAYCFIAGISLWLAHRRDDRRWWQALITGHWMGILNNVAREIRASERIRSKKDLAQNARNKNSVREVIRPSCIKLTLFGFSATIIRLPRLPSR